jgi:hypothetical protein
VVFLEGVHRWKRGAFLLSGSSCQDGTKWRVGVATGV